jgi:hypothetical protein
MNQTYKILFEPFVQCSITNKPHKSKCSSGDISRCLYNRAIVRRQSVKFNKNEVHTLLNLSLLTKVMPVHQRITSDYI